MTNLDSILKSRDVTLSTKVILVKTMVSCMVWELDCEEGWALKNWCFWTVVLEKTLASPLDCKEIEPVHSKGDQSWVFIGRTDVEAETPVLWPPDAKNWLIGKDPDAGRDWGQEEKGTTEDEMAGWHHRLDGHGFGWTLGVGDGRRPGVLRFVGSQRVRQDWATELNWTDSAYKLNKQGDNITALMYSFPNLQPVCCSMYSFNCCFLTCIQISQEAGQVVWYFHL